MWKNLNVSSCPNTVVSYAIILKKDFHTKVPTMTHETNEVPLSLRTLFPEMNGTIHELSGLLHYVTVLE